MIRLSGSRRRTPIREYWREVADSLVRLSRAARNAAQTFDMRRMQTVVTHVLNFRKLSGKLEIELGRTVSTHDPLQFGRRIRTENLRDAAKHASSAKPRQNRAVSPNVGGNCSSAFRVTPRVTPTAVWLPVDVIGRRQTCK